MLAEWKKGEKISFCVVCFQGFIIYQFVKLGWKMIKTMNVGVRKEKFEISRRLLAIVPHSSFVTFATILFKKIVFLFFLIDLICLCTILIYLTNLSITLQRNFTRLSSARFLRLLRHIIWLLN